MTTTYRGNRRTTMADRMHVRRSRGMLSGVLLVLLGVWGGIIPFVGPVFGYAFTPDVSWHFTWGRLWLEILPAAATVLSGLLLIGSANRPVSLFAGWLGSIAGAWFIVGETLSMLWNGGAPAAGVPAATGSTLIAVEQIGFFLGLGAVILFLSATALGRVSVVGVSDIREPVDDTDRGTTTSRTAEDDETTTTEGSRYHESRAAS